MAIAIIDINDIGLRCFHGHTQIVSPGYALLGKDGVITGEQALRRSYLEPQQAFNQFWRQLSLSPLSVASQFARHHADLAYAQLSAMYREAGEPDEVVFAVPGNYSDDQLSILLGLGKALPFTVKGFVDAAVVSCAHLGRGDWIYVDVQLHQTVLTQIRIAERAERVRVELLPEVGLKNCYAIWAHQIANQYIQQYRYDPLHTAAGEQQLHDKLPDWIGELRDNSELPIALETTQGALRLNLNRADILEAGAGLRQSLASVLDKLTNGVASVAYSHRIRQLPGFEINRNAVVIGEEALLQNCLASLELISADDEGVSFISCLPVSQTSVETDGASTGLISGEVSHVLVNGIAHRIGEKLALVSGREGLQPAKTAEGAAITIARVNGRVTLQAPGRRVETHASLDDLRPGDAVTVEGAQLQLIEVR